MCLHQFVCVSYPAPSGLVLLDVFKCHRGAFPNWVASVAMGAAPRSSAAHCPCERPATCSTPAAPARQPARQPICQPICQPPRLRLRSGWSAASRHTCAAACRELAMSVDRCRGVSLSSCPSPCVGFQGQTLEGYRFFPRLRFAVSALGLQGERGASWKGVAPRPSIHRMRRSL